MGEERDEMWGEGKKTWLRAHLIAINSSLSTMTYTYTLLNALHDTLSANQCRWTLLFTFHSIHFAAYCCETLLHTCRHLKCGLAHGPTWHTDRQASLLFSPSAREMTHYLWSCPSLKILRDLKLCFHFISLSPFDLFCLTTRVFRKAL